MAIFKKFAVSETETSTSLVNKKISNNAIAPSSFTSFSGFSSQPSQHNRKSSDSSNNPPRISHYCQDSTNAQGQECLISDEIEDLCWHIYNLRLRRDQCRLIVFSEKDNRLLYDSDTVVQTSDRLISGSHKSQCGRFQFLPHKYDTLKIAKMLFGTLPTAMKPDSLKIHTLRDSKQIMISRIFSVPKPGKYSPFKSRDLYKCMVGSLSSDSDNQSNYSTIHSMEGIRDNDTGNSYPGRFPVSSKSIVNSDPPESFVRVRNSSLQLESNDAEDIMEELRAFSPNRLSRTRRRQLSQFGLDDNISIRLSNRSRLSSCSSVADACGLSESSTDWNQYGFAIILPANFRPFVFHHILQIERELDKLIVHIHKAVQDKSQFFQSIYEGWVSVFNSISLLCNSMRLKNPVWLSLISSDPQRKEAIATEFCGSLANLIGCLNNKENKFFLSTLLSAVLMNQLTWVASVAPPEKCSNNDRSLLLLGTSVIDPRQMSYNPTVAQLLELYYGSSEGCHQFTKVVVLGENQRIIGQLLNVLSYFIRCSSVESRRNEIFESSMTDNEDQLHDFGRSLLAGICDSYSPHFVLSGIRTSPLYYEDVIHSIYEDVRHPLGEPCTNSQLIQNLSPSSSQALATSNSESKSQLSPNGDQQQQVHSQQRSSRISIGKSSPEKVPKQYNNFQEEERNNSLVVVITLDNFAVRMISAQNCHVEDIPFVCPSEAVTSMLEEFGELYDYKCATNFLLSFLEDRLGSLLAKSNVLANLVNTTDMREPLSMERVSTILNCDCSDLRLILNIASVYSPGILATAL